MKPPYNSIESLRAGSVEEFIAYAREIPHAGFPSEVGEIHYLMASLDAFRLLESWDHDNPLNDESWEPKTRQVQEIVRRLIAQENRPGLRRWYARFKKSPCSDETQAIRLNSTAERFRRYLSRLAKEDF